MLNAPRNDNLTDDEAIESIRQIMARNAPPTLAEIVAGIKCARLVEDLAPLTLTQKDECQGAGAYPARCRELGQLVGQLQHNMILYSTGGSA